MKDKLMGRQAGPPGPAVIRILVVDFSQADTGWPEFICWPNIARRLSETVHLLAADIPGTLPYDAVLPAHLGLDCFFGSAIWIDVSKRAPGEAFVGQAELDKPCLSKRENQGLSVETLLEGLSPSLDRTIGRHS